MSRCAYSFLWIIPTSGTVPMFQITYQIKQFILKLFIRLKVFYPEVPLFSSFKPACYHDRNIGLQHGRVLLE